MEQHTKNIVDVSDSDWNIDKMKQEVKAEREKQVKKKTREEYE